MDKKNTVYAKSILLKYGWLTTDEISSEANEGLFIIVQHCADTEVQSLCLLLIDKILADHPEERWHYAFLTDRFAMNQGADQIYGTQKIIQEGYPYPIPLKYPTKVDSLRTTVGLPPFWKTIGFCPSYHIFGKVSTNDSFSCGKLSVNGPSNFSLPGSAR